MKNRLIVGCAALMALLGATGAERLLYPQTRVVDVRDTYFGHTVADPYRWLENPKDPEVFAWATAQTKIAANFLHSRPSYAGYAQRIAELRRTSTQRFGLQIRGGRYLYLRQTPPQPQPQLVVRDGLGGPERVLFDPMQAAAGTATPAIESVYFAPDGSRVAFTTQLGGSEDETLHIVDAATGRMAVDTLPHVGGGTSPTALAWDGDAQGFLHTQWPKNPDGSYASAGILLYHHKLGTDSSSDTYVFGRNQSPRAEYVLDASLDGKFAAASLADGDGVHATIFERTGAGAFVRVAAPEDGIGTSGEFGGAFVGDTLAVISQKRDPRGEVVGIAPGGTFASGRVLVPASSVVIRTVIPAAGGFATSDVDGGDGSARLFSMDGAARGTVPVPPIST